MTAWVPELRAFPIVAAVPVGHTVAFIGDDRHAPHFRPGEFAVVDTTEREIVFGEVYLIYQSRGPLHWQIAGDHRPEADQRAPTFTRSKCRGGGPMAVST